MRCREGWTGMGGSGRKSDSGSAGERESGKRGGWERRSGG